MFEKCWVVTKAWHGKISDTINVEVEGVYRTDEEAYDAYSSCLISDIVEQKIFGDNVAKDVRERLKKFDDKPVERMTYLTKVFERFFHKGDFQYDIDYVCGSDQKFKKR